MASQLGALRNALLEAKVSPGAAERAAEEVAAYDNRISRVESSLSVLKWMAGANITLTIVVLGLIFTLALRVADTNAQVAGQLAQLSAEVLQISKMVQH